MLNPNDNFDYVLEGFEDEVDCAIMNDPEFREAVADMASKQSTAEEEVDHSEDEIVDTVIDYDESTPDADIVDMDADDLIAAERDIAHDPFEDDELIDIAIGEDPEIDDIDLDDEE